MQLSVQYELVGTGWAKCVIADEDSRCELTASYMSDALGKLVLGALGIQSGLQTVAFSFDEEPGEYRWVIRALEPSDVEIELYAFDKVTNGNGIAHGRPLFSTMCPSTVFAKAVRDAATGLLEQHGERGYRDRWAEHPFPTRLLYLLSETLTTPAKES
jgi:hypothetical protein